jgi:hypothetical protein
MSETIILCEGYHDRAFWGGWLEYLGCIDPGRGDPRKPVFDPEGKEVVKSQFGYRTPTESFVRLIQCQGRTRVRDEASKRLRKESDRWKQGASESLLARLVLSIDSDLAMNELSTENDFTTQNLLSWLRELDKSAQADETSGKVLMFDCRTAVSRLCWEVVGTVVPGVPDKQTLERLVCSAIVAAYPERGEPVQRWLDTRPNAPPAGPKHFAWSHNAGWYAESGGDTFYRKLWKNKDIVQHLRSHLEACGAWQIAEELAR